MKNSYFNFNQWVLILFFALCGALMNLYLPLKGFLDGLEMSGPAKGMALFGGFFFVLWVYLARRVMQKKYAAITTAVILASVCLFLSPWYGVMNPYWFSIYGLLALAALGFWVEVFYDQMDWLGGGLGNLFCLGITWLAFGLHLQNWPEADLPVLPLIAAFVSGVLGVQLVRVTEKLVHSLRGTKITQA